MPHPIRVGIVGLGFMGATHVAAYGAAARDGHPCRLAAVADPDAGRRAGRLAAGGNLPSGADAAAFDPADVRGYAAADELFADPKIELVSICTHTDTHADLAAKAMRAGKDVLLEKPVAVATADVERLAAVARETGRVCMPAMCMRFWPQWAWLRGRIVDQAYGELRSLTLTRLGSRPGWTPFYADASRSGGALIDLHVHDTDFVCACFGAPGAVDSTGDENYLRTNYQCDLEVPVTAEGGWLHEGFAFRMRYVAVFDDATADFDVGRDPPLLLCRAGGATAVDCGPLTGYDGEIRHLVDALAGGGTPELSLDDAVVTHRVLDAERQSLARRQAVFL